MAETAPSRSILKDLSLALLLAAAMTLFWAMRDWTNLSALILPDTDDMARLQQVRDLIAGQGWSDLTQYRLADGLAMHWSRLGDIGPAAILVALRPLLGSHDAQIAAVILYPMALFAATLFFAGQAAHNLGREQARGPALVLGLLAYPMTGLFLPGRIDHHGLQILLSIAIVTNLTAPPSFRRGIVAGVLAGLSLTIGLEAVAMVAGATIATWWEWMARPGPRLSGFGIGILAASCVSLLLFVPDYWPIPLCDSFTPPIATLTITAGALLATLGLAGWPLAGPARWIATGFAAATMLLCLPIAAPACLAGPYGAVDPELARLWLSHVAEAKPLWQQPLGIAIGYAGMMIVGLVVTLLSVRRGQAWRLLALMQLCTAAIAMVQSRACPIAATLAIPALAAWIARVRQRQQTGATLGAWLAGCGMTYAMIGAGVSGNAQPVAAQAAVGSCKTPEALAQLNRLPAGRVLAPIDLGPYILAATHHSVVAAPYHRNAKGNLASIHFFGGGERRAHAIASAEHVTYVATCANGSAAPGSMGSALESSHPPHWLRRVVQNGALSVYWVVR